MKKLLLLSVLLLTIFIACTKEDIPPIPEPIVTDTTTILVTPIDTNIYESIFMGNWDCYDWVVETYTGTTRHRKFLFSERKTNSIFQASLNDYNSSGKMYQLITMAMINIDSNYFDLSGSPSGMKFKGYLLTDSTMIIYQYDFTGTGIDTSQSKIFYKELP